MASSRAAGAPEAGPRAPWRERTPRSRQGLLAIYLNDHLAGATGGVELARRMAVWYPVPGQQGDGPAHWGCYFLISPGMPATPSFAVVCFGRLTEPVEQADDAVA